MADSGDFDAMAAITTGTLTVRTSLVFGLGPASRATAVPESGLRGPEVGETFLDLTCAFGEICTNGIVCGSSDQSLLDFISVAVDCNGLAHITYGGNSKQQEAAGETFVHAATQKPARHSPRPRPATPPSLNGPTPPRPVAAPGDRTAPAVSATHLQSGPGDGSTLRR